MSERNAELFVADILESIESIIEFTKDLNLETFSQNKMVKDAVVRNFEVIGEAAKNLPEKIKSKYSEIPWKEMAGMRDKVIHEYFGIDIDIVWQTIKTLPKLIPLIENIKDI